MGDEETGKPITRQLRRPKIVISKCKKPSPELDKPATEDFKKVNGELATENKGKTIEDSEVEILEEKVQEHSKTQTKSAKLLLRSFQNKKKRKLSKANDDDDDDDDDVIVIESDSSLNEEKRDRSDDSPTVEFKGFKKRILAEQSEKSKDVATESGEQVKHDSPTETVQDQEKKGLRPRITKLTKTKKKVAAGVKKVGESDGDEAQTDSQAEYAQYLGLQPTMQFKCYRCGEKGFQSMLALNMHQRGCGVSQKSNFLSNIQQDTSADPNMLTNFRITRKVYLCSACGTYYENWNLFLHMRDVHKKHICLFCLAMFGVADKLADHLKSAHSIQEGLFSTSEDFLNIYKGSFYLICCTCENLFNEREDYFHHNCVKRDPTAKCNLCGVKCGHYYTCPNNVSTTRTVPSAVGVSQAIPVGKPQPSSLSRLLGPEIKGNWRGKKGQGKVLSDNDDDYDISHAASFCHVDIGDEAGERDKSGTEDNPVVLSEDDDNQKSDEQEKRTSVSTELAENKESTITGDTADNKEGKQSQPAQNIEDTTSENSSEERKEKEDARLNDDINNQIPEESTKQIQEESTNQIQEESTKQISEEVDICNETKTFDEQTNENEETSKAIPETNNSQEDIPEGHLENEDSASEENSLDLPSKSVDNKDSEVKESECVQDSNEDNSPTLNNDSKESVTSDSDIEPATYQSASHDDSDSSSDESPKEDITGHKSSLEINKDDSVSSDDSGKSGLVMDEKQKNLNNDIEDKDHGKTNLSEDDSRQRHESASHSESTQDTNDVPMENNQTESIGKENGSANTTIEEAQDSAPEDINDGIVLASEDVPAMALTLEDKLEDAILQSVVKECVRTSCLNCVYCSHATKIAVNGKQLALHLLAEHRYKPVKNNETSKDVIKKLKSSLSDLEQLFFNTDSYDSSDKSLNVPYDYTYECFQCRFVTNVHKELYVHKRKMHQKTVLLCVMCKSNFYSYSELLCHMCPGIYLSEDICFRCCFCNMDMIPSAFRLMVHLRKSHHTCDICLEVAGDQQRLSTHMWKHKLNHLCYRCGIAYRNKPDITKHLFWKHGTESVLCKKCLQKKWPHVYHFCIPPTSFICEECNASFTKAVALKVHKRFHGGELPYSCTICDQKFVSKKLLAKHEDIHKEPPPSERPINENDPGTKLNESTEDHINVESVDEPSIENTTIDESSKEITKGEETAHEAVPDSKIRKKKKKDKDRKGKPVMDVYDLPPLNLSSASDSSDDEDGKITTPEKADENQPPVQIENTEKGKNESNEIMEPSNSDNIEALDENQTPAPVVDGVWDSFHSYKAELEKRESKDLSLPNILPSTSLSEPNVQPEPIPEEDPNWFLMDHSYCLIPGKPKATEEEPIISEPAPTEGSPVKASEDIPAPRGHSSSIDHAYATLNSTNGEAGLTPTAEQPSLDNKPPTTPPPSSTTPLDSHSSSKKKLKTPKKKKHTSNSSSSSDSSSDSDTSSCHSCGTNCSCSSSSSGSSSSDSSDSESSTSEGKRKIAAKREKKKEKLKHKHQKDEPMPVPEEFPPQLPPEEEPVVDAPPEPIELPIRESDLDTDESSTDEDFYDKYPQSHAKQQLEKSKLMLLASVAPVNNGTVSPPPSVEKPPPPPPASKRKIKTKKRRKSLNLQSKKGNKKPALTQHTQPSTSVAMQSATSTPTHFSSNHLNLPGKVASPLRTPVTTFHSDATAGSGSENESARLSKRKRVRNKFYGYSSEEEEHEVKPGLKWRKVEPVPPQQPPTAGYSFHTSTPAQRHAQAPSSQLRRPKPEPQPSESSGTEDESPIKKEESSSSSSSSESDNEVDTKPVATVQKAQTEKSDNLYCYCQCPYDEVSEMIACDGQDCTIEWFHFECVGIMVPPKGKWYCPDCRKRRDLM